MKNRSALSGLPTLNNTRMDGGAVHTRVQLEKARELAEQGKGAKTIVKSTGVDFTEARRIVKSHREAAKRKSHKDILSDMLVATRLMLGKAQAGFLNDPSGKQAYAVQAIMSEQRAILEQLSKEEKPEESALSIIQDVIQPFLKDFLQDVVVESRRAMMKCSSVVDSAQQRHEIEGAFGELTRTIGSIASDHYGLTSQRVCTILSCDMEDVKRIANTSDKIGTPNE